MFAETLHHGPGRACYRASAITVSFTGMERIASRFPAGLVLSQSDTFLLTKSTNNNKGISAQALELSWSSVNGVVLRLFY